MKKRTKPKVFSGLLCTCGKSFSVFSLFVALLLGSASLLAQQANQKTISIDFKDFSVLRALHEINRLGGNVVTFREEVVMKEAKKITLKRENTTVFEAVKACLEGTGLTCSQQANGKILVGPKQESNLLKISGRIVDEKGNPVAGATVMIVGTTQGVASDGEGQYTIAAKPDDVLRVSFIGYKTVTVDVKGKSKLNVTLNPTEENLEEVTVVAFGEQKKESVVSSITTVRPMDLKSSSSDLTSSFAGKIAGIIGWQTGGAPGALTEEEMNTKFYIRGISSSNGVSEPLVLIDGVESSRLDLARMAPEDIESFSVLKDASATAMYGARGANGVILVTTKKGEAGSVYTSVRYEAVASMPTDKIEVVDPKTYMLMYNEALITRNPSATPAYSLTKIERTGDPRYPSWLYPANDWYKILFKDVSINHRVGVNVRGGSELVQYYASVNYVNDEGMLKTDKLNQFDVNIKNSTLSSRLNLNVNLNAGIRLLANTSFSVDKYHGPKADVHTAYAMAFNASPVDFAPTYPGDKENGWPHLRFGNVKGRDDVVNPYASIQAGYTERGRFSLTSRLEYIHNLSTLLKGLELRASVSYSNSNYFQEIYETKPFYYACDPENGGYDFETGEHFLTPVNNNGRRTLGKPELGTGISRSISTQWVYEGRLLHMAAWGEHQTSLTAVFQARQASHAPTKDLYDGIENRNLSFSMRGSYGFLDRYFVEASFGYNGSERFTKNNRMGFFPSAGAAWIVSKENFLQGASNIVSFLKLRGSYGKVGNDGIIATPRFVYMPQIGKSEYVNAGVYPEVGNDDAFRRKQIQNYGDPDVKWEISEQVNLGLESRFFRDVLELNVDIYQEIRHNIIANRTVIPANMGIELYPLDNMGKVRSRGMDLSAKVQHAFSPDFWIILNGTFTYNKAVYKELEEATDKPRWQWKKGHEISQQIGYIAEGLFHDQAEIDNSPTQSTAEPGDIRYRDINGDGTIDVEDAVHIGFPETPRIIYGFSGFVNYKNWEFNFSFQGSGNRGFFLNPGALSPFVNDHAMLKAIYDSHWTEKNASDRPFWPRLSTQSITVNNPQEDWDNINNGERKSTYFMRECRFLRCTSLEVAYNLPLNLRTKLRMQNVKFFARANNPFMFSNFKLWDVELGENGFNYPIQKTYAVGVSVSF
ncbi:SusC/RagA family TonB-linked outer membrane protein [Butyricimonas hominis]|uniref:TonB-dependent receptor n=1 Tax=Butyricimonas hominis TaxID=2763032 RepID=A0ABR7D0P5_9BACT|nr:TonB-dependent receptor [Butyricimonas hominis]MBC5621409.1 TonB-dependent receptor [Butyricimonas hominis]